MGKFNTAAHRPAATSPITTLSKVPNARTYEGGEGYLRDPKSELFMLAVTNFVGEKTFYEGANARDSRFEDLIAQVAVDDNGADWLRHFALWLRTEANMRSASLVLAAETVHTRLKKGLHGGNRQIVNAVLQRPDEPGEFLAYWIGKYGLALPMPVKRGVGDAALRLYNERSYLKYDGPSKEYRFHRVLNLVHPSDAPGWQNILFRYILDSHYKPETKIPAELSTLTANAELRSKSPEKILKWAKNGKLADKLMEAGMTWEAVPSLVNGPWTKELWEAIIPNMGAMALTRNLRNFDQAGVSDEVAATVAAKISDPEQVKRSRQLPMRYLSAHRAAPSLRWGYPLEKALDASLQNVPELKGRTLILIDTSSSMHSGFSKDGTLMRWDAAALFGLALSRRCENADVVSYSSAQFYWSDPVGSKTKVFESVKGESVLKSVERWDKGGYFLGGGTDTPGALRKHYANHDRVVLLTDEQVGVGTGRVSEAMPQNRPLYTFNLAGYRVAHAPSGTGFRHEFGGLTDQMFGLIPLLESRSRKAPWPWEI